MKLVILSMESNREMCGEWIALFISSPRSYQTHMFRIYLDTGECRELSKTLVSFRRSKLQIFFLLSILRFFYFLISNGIF